MHVIVDSDTREILGAAVLGPGGDEAVHVIVSMMSSKARFELLAHTVAIHPTVIELIPTILGEHRDPNRHSLRLPILIDEFQGRLEATVVRLLAEFD